MKYIVQLALLSYVSTQFCAVEQHVVESTDDLGNPTYACEDCASGTTRPAGDDLTAGAATSCTACDVDAATGYAAQDGLGCVVETCADGFIPNTDATACEEEVSTACIAEQHVVESTDDLGNPTYACEDCASGTTRDAGDDPAAGAATSCTACDVAEATGYAAQDGLGCVVEACADGFIPATMSGNNGNGALACEPEVSTSATSGDPHFYGFDGDRFDVQGIAGRAYNIFSDTDLQYNAHFTKDKYLSGNVLGAAVIKVGLDSIYIDRGDSVKLNGVEVSPGAQVALSLQGSSIYRTGNPTKVVITTPEYKLRLALKVGQEGEGLHLNHKLSVTKAGIQRILGRKWSPHGLLGQTLDLDGKARIGAVGHSAQGEGAIDGIFHDYEVPGLSSDDFKFNRFGVMDDSVRPERISAKEANEAIVTQSYEAYAW